MIVQRLMSIQLLSIRSMIYILKEYVISFWENLNVFIFDFFVAESGVIKNQTEQIT